MCGVNIRAALASCHENSGRFEGETLAKLAESVAIFCGILAVDSVAFAQAAIVVKRSVQALLGRLLKSEKTCIFGALESL